MQQLQSKANSAANCMSQSVQIQLWNFDPNIVQTPSKCYFRNDPTSIKDPLNIDQIIPWSHLDPSDPEQQTKEIIQRECKERNTDKNGEHIHRFRASFVY